MTACSLSCYMHHAAAFALKTGQRDWLRANLPSIRRLGRTLWARKCTCGMLERVEEAIRGNRA